MYVCIIRHIKISSANIVMICFYRATRMHSADYAVARCLCSYPSGTHQHCVETAEHIIKLFSPPGGHTILVFPYQTFWQYSDGNPTSGYVQCRGYEKGCDFRPMSRFVSETIQDRAIVTIKCE